jgi:branched-chain amino acid transport system ATP-binding protein
VSALLEATGLGAAYAGVPVLRDIDLRVEAGETVCVLGPNGAGKTTLLRALSATLPRTTGRVWLSGRDMTRLPAHRRTALGLVHVPEGRGNLIPALTVAEHLRLAGSRAGRAGFREHTAQVEELFPVLAHRRTQQAGTLSGGQQQLAVALGIMLGPRLLLVDEPSTGLAPSVAEEVFDRLGSLREHGITVLVAEQRLDLALHACDRGYVLERGTVAAHGSASELRDSALVRESYLGG